MHTVRNYRVTRIQSVVLSGLMACMFALVVRADDCHHDVVGMCDPSTGVCVWGIPFCENVPPSEEPVPAPDDSGGDCGSEGGSGSGGSGSGSGPSLMTTMPVNKAYGHKQEMVVDLSVPLAGRDFVLSRSYISTTGLSDGWFGRNWQLNVGSSVERSHQTDGTSDASLRIVSLGTGASYFNKDSNTPPTWLPTGPTQQFIQEAELQVDIG